jgi:ATP-dependent RNA helicase DeaD
MEENALEVDITFKDLIFDKAILKAVDELGFSAPTPVQKHTIPLAQKGQDLIVQAQTGSGKTFAFVVPLLEHLYEKTRVGTVSGDDTFALIVTPTRELASQIREVIASISNINAPCLIGGMSSSAQLRDIDKERRIIVGTPGRLMEFIRERHIDLSRCQYFVLDEADEMLSMDFLEDIKFILSRLPKVRQGLFISATITPRVESLANTFLTNYERVVIETPLDQLPSIEHRYYDIDGDVASKATALCDLLETSDVRSAIIFCNTRSDTELVEVFLRRRGFDARRINSDLSQKQRDQVMKKIRAGELRFLVGTDIAARGIDIDLIDAVINYTLPDQPEVYVHRTGRTGRAGRTGIAMSLVGPGDFSAFRQLQKETAVDLQQTELPSESEIVAARKAHFKELFDSARVSVQPRDIQTAEALLADSADSKTLVAKLYRFCLEHMLAPDTKALEEELAENEESRERGGRYSERSSSDSHGGPRSRSHGRNDRHDSRSGPRDDRRGGRSGGSRDRRN